MEDIAATVARLRERVAQSERQRAGAEYARQQAEQAVQTAMEALKAEFGVDTLEQAQALQADLDRKIAEEAALIEKALG